MKFRNAGRFCNPPLVTFFLVDRTGQDGNFFFSIDMPNEFVFYAVVALAIGPTPASFTTKPAATTGSWW